MRQPRLPHRLASLLTLLLLPLALPLAAQSGPAADSPPPASPLTATVTGQVVDTEGEPVPLAQVAVRGTVVRALADDGGRYTVDRLPAGPWILLVSALGYGTVEVPLELVSGETARRDVVLSQAAIGLNPIVVTATRKRTFVSESPVKVDVIPGRTLQSMASTSLMESIQTVNGLYQQVDCAVCYTANIRINGMEGPYTSVLIDGQPIMSSLASVYGLEGINPALVERIEIIKGPSSTLYGSDAMAGVINVITKDPRFAPRLSVDVQRTDHGFTDVDVAAAPSFGPVSALLSGTFHHRGDFLDANGDDFADLTMDTRVSLFGKVHVAAERGSGLALTARYYDEDRFGGERGWTEAFRGSGEVYGESIRTERFELLADWGLPVPGQDISLEVSAVHHVQDAMYGDSPYNADQQVVAGHLIWDRPVGTTHDLLLGVGAQMERFDDESPATVEPVSHVVPGIFAQDEVALTPDLRILAGLRLDHHENHGFILSPRAAVKVEPFEHTAVRLNAGTGFRVVDLFTEDYASLTHTRRLVTADGLQPEESWNLTLNVNQVIPSQADPLMIDLDVFYTRFSNRIIPDYDSDPRRIVYHNLDGFGVTRGVGVTLNHNVTSLGLDYTVGATLQDVFYEHEGVREEELFSADFKASWTATWTPRDLPLALDVAGRLIGPMRLPAYDAPFERPTRSETYAVHDLMATWTTEDGLQIYAGAKNLLDYAQPSPIVDPGNPFGDSFDTAWVYGPVYGRSLLAGVRWALGR